MTSLRAIPRICPRVRNCSLSGSKFAAQGRKISEAMRPDPNGIVTEIGNAPRKAIQSGSYENLVRSYRHRSRQRGVAQSTLVGWPSGSSWGRSGSSGVVAVLGGPPSPPKASATRRLRPSGRKACRLLNRLKTCGRHPLPAQVDPGASLALSGGCGSGPQRRKLPPKPGG